MESVKLVDSGMTMLSGSNPLLQDMVEMQNTTSSMININIIPEMKLIPSACRNPTPMLWKAMVEDSAKIPMNG